MALSNNHRPKIERIFNQLGLADSCKTLLDPGSSECERWNRFNYTGADDGQNQRLGNLAANFANGDSNYWVFGDNPGAPASDDFRYGWQHGQPDGNSPNEFWQQGTTITCIYGATNATWMDNLHKDGAKWSFLFWCNPSNAADGTIFATCNNGATQVGVRILHTTANGLCFALSNGTAISTTCNVASVGNLYDGTWKLLGLVIDEAAGRLTFHYNDTPESQNRSYTSPSSAAATHQTRLYSRPGASNTESGAGMQRSKIGPTMIWGGRALTNTEVASLYTATKDRFYPLDSIGLNANLEIMLDAHDYNPNVLPPDVTLCASESDSFSSGNQHQYPATWIGDPSPDRQVVVLAFGANVTAGKTVTEMYINSTVANDITTAACTVCGGAATMVVPTGNTCDINVQFTSNMSSYAHSVFTIKNYAHATYMSDTNNNAIGATGTATHALALTMESNSVSLWSFVKQATGLTVTETSGFFTGTMTSEPTMSYTNLAKMHPGPCTHTETVTWSSATGTRAAIALGYFGSNLYWRDTSGKNQHFMRSGSRLSNNANPTLCSGTPNNPKSIYPRACWTFADVNSPLDAALTGSFCFSGVNSNAHPTVINSLHKNGANATILAWLYSAANNNGQSTYFLATTNTAAASIGANFRLAAANRSMIFAYGNGTTHTEIDSGLIPVTDQWIMAGLQIDETAGTFRFFYTNSSLQFTSNVVSATFSSPSSANSTYRARIGARPGSSDTSPSSDWPDESRLGEILVWSRTLSNTEVNTYFHYTRQKYGLS